MGTDSPSSLLDRQIRHYSREEFAKVFNGVLGERLSNRPAQDVNDESLLQNYVVGSRRVEGLTVYHYAKMLATFGITIASQCRGVVNSCTGHFQNTSAAPLIVAVGSMTIPILDAVSAAHLYRNGRIVVWSATEWYSYDIVDSDVSDGTDVVLHLRTPVRVAIAAGTFCEVHENPYSAVRAPSGDGFETFVGIPQRYLTAGYFFWLPTWG